MGLLRVLLALFVAVSHFAGRPFAGSYTAVQVFYIVSGFYMATILTEKYDPRKDIRIFFSNRFLRIYSVYFACLLISFVAYYILYRTGRPAWFVQAVADDAKLLRWPTKLWLAFTTFFVFGQETLLFFKIKNGALAFAPEGPVGAHQVWLTMAVPQAWSISLELMFYCLVPFLIRNRTRVLIGIIAATLLLRMALYRVGYDFDPWVSRFFPAELGLFVLGMVARRVYDAGIRASVGGIGRYVQIVIAVSFLAASCSIHELIVFSESLDFSFLYVIWPYFFSAVIAVPCLFHLTRHSSADSFIGNFSYPIYLIHWAVMICYDALAPELHWPVRDSWIRIAILVVVTVSAAWAVMAGIETPMDRYRQRRFAAKAAP